jgi:hypothetical protein
MATTSKIPAKLAKVLLNALFSQVDIIYMLAEKAALDALNLPINIKCTDPSVIKIRELLTQINESISVLVKLIDVIQKAGSILNGIASVMQILKVIELLIPAVNGAPAGPSTDRIIEINKTVDNVMGVVNSINVAVKLTNSTLKSVNSMIAAVLSKLGSACPDEEFTVSQEVDDILNNTNKRNIISEYPSKFYDEINVSNSDIDNRLQEIQQLLNDELDVVSNLIEAPSKLIKKSGNPAIDDGNVGDFYMNMQNGSVFGPKTESGW